MIHFANIKSFYYNVKISSLKIVSISESFFSIYLTRQIGLNSKVCPTKSSPPSAQLVLHLFKLTANPL